MVTGAALVAAAGTCTTDAGAEIVDEADTGGVTEVACEGDEVETETFPFAGATCGELGALDLLPDRGVFATSETITCGDTRTAEEETVGIVKARVRGEEGVGKI